MIKADGFTFREPIQLDLTRGEAFPGIFYLLSKIFMKVKPWIKSPSKSWTIIISYNHQQITITALNLLGSTGWASPGLGVVKTRPAK